MNKFKKHPKPHALKRTLANISFACMIVAGLVFAASLQEAKDLHAKGDWAGATKIALSLKTSNGYVQAAHSNSVAAQQMPESQQAALFDQSENYANQAIALDAANADAYFERGRAIGRLSQLRGTLNALSQGYVPSIRDNFEKALKINPKQTAAMNGLAIWHAEVFSQGVAWIYNADIKKISMLFDQAIQIDPNIIIHRVEYARALMMVDPIKNKAKATELLEKAVSFKPNNAEERIDFERAKRDLNNIKK